MSAEKILHLGIEAIADRANERDRPQGERSMRAAVEAFNAITGHPLAERDGWMFMVLLKASRAQGGAFRMDDFVDGAAYFALCGEAAGQDR